LSNDITKRNADVFFLREEKAVHLSLQLIIQMQSGFS
jgi:hypothetical protein